MEWYEIVISAVATLGGVGGLISLYKAKPEKTSIEVQNMKEMLGEAHKMFDKMKEEEFQDLYERVKHVLFTIFLPDIAEEDFFEALKDF